MSAPEPIAVRVYYDFASTLCYVAHRVMARMQGVLDELELVLDWVPIDLTRLGHFRRGDPVPALRLRNAERVAAELGVAVDPLRVWPDSRLAGGAALLAARCGREPSWRERAFTAVFEERRELADARAVEALGRELSLALPEAEVERAAATLGDVTERERDEMVTGVPTFMLGPWPFGGIQTEDTMQHVLTRFAGRARSGALS